MRWVTFDAIADYARLDRGTIAQAVDDGDLSVSLLDPWALGETLLSRQDVDTWWRWLVLSR
jgi:hypothetical protein